METDRTWCASLAAVCRAALAALTSLVSLQRQIEAGFAARRDGSF
jgi:hypothetical protein